MVGCKIIDVDYYLPEVLVTNDDLLRFVDVSTDYIEDKLGISERYFMGEGETTSSMGIADRKILLARNEGAKAKIDLLIAVTQSPDHVLLGIAPVI